MLPARRQAFPIFPLNAVLFPGGVLPIKVFEQRYMTMAKHCLKDNSPFGVCLIREGQEVGSPAVPESVGCTARISAWDMEQLGVLQVRTLGEDRFRIVESHTSNGLIIAEVETIAAEEEAEVPVEFTGCAELVRKVIERVGEESFAPPYRYENASWVGYRLAELLPIKVAAKQKLMELTDPMARLEVLAQFLTQQGLMR
ncbi:MAG: LON peptidase substrate-binding domain-containing protein [Burkholderiales bacterium]|nr:LON peptidase substrate-binding domain-containing protein [Burkholderiales bacterium]